MMDQTSVLNAYQRLTEQLQRNPDDSQARQEWERLFGQQWPMGPLGKMSDQ